MKLLLCFRLYVANLCLFRCHIELLRFVKLSIGNKYIRITFLDLKTDRPKDRLFTLALDEFKIMVVILTVFVRIWSCCCFIEFWAVDLIFRTYYKSKIFSEWSLLNPREGHVVTCFESLFFTACKVNLYDTFWANFNAHLCISTKFSTNIYLCKGWLILSINNCAGEAFSDSFICNVSACNYDVKSIYKH